MRLKQLYIRNSTLCMLMSYLCYHKRVNHFSKYNTKLCSSLTLKKVNPSLWMQVKAQSRTHVAWMKRHLTLSIRRWWCYWVGEGFSGTLHLFLLNLPWIKEIEIGLLQGLLLKNSCFVGQKVSKLRVALVFPNSVSVCGSGHIKASVSNLDCIRAQGKAFTLLPPWKPNTL